MARQVNLSLNLNTQVLFWFVLFKTWKAVADLTQTSRPLEFIGQLVLVWLISEHQVQWETFP